MTKHTAQDANPLNCGSADPSNLGSTTDRGLGSLAGAKEDDSQKVTNVERAMHWDALELEEVNNAFACIILNCLALNLDLECTLCVCACLKKSFRDFIFICLLFISACTMSTCSFAVNIFMAGL